MSDQTETKQATETTETQADKAQKDNATVIEIIEAYRGGDFSSRMKALEEQANKLRSEYGEVNRQIVSLKSFDANATKMLMGIVQVMGVADPDVLTRALVARYGETDKPAAPRPAPSAATLKAPARARGRKSPPPTVDGLVALLPQKTWLQMKDIVAAVGWNGASVQPIRDIVQQAVTEGKITREGEKAQTKYRRK
jgi:hypothetical protein